MAINRTKRVRRGVLVPLVALLLVFILGMVAFAIDIGFTALVTTQLQATADAAALAAVRDLSSQSVATTAAQHNANLNHAGNGTVVTGTNVERGRWDSATRTFQPSTTGANSVRVTATRTKANGNPVGLFFAPVLGINTADVTATAIASARHRDIAFIIDLSGSMNNDTEIWATSAINGAFPGYPTVGSDLIANVFQDFNYGTYPGVTRHIGEGYIPSAQLTNNAYNYLANTYLYNNMSVAAQYRTLSGDGSSTRKQKTYSWIIDIQMASIMPNATPALNSSTNYNYWAAYLDYMINGGSNPPPNQQSYRISSASNPYPDAWPSLTSSSYSSYVNKVGYLTYVQFMMDYGRNVNVTGSTKVPLSIQSPLCPWTPDTDPNSAGNGYTFPPREQPTHGARVAMMAAINKVRDINQDVPDAYKDHVCVISFDTASGVTIRYPLSANSCDYEAAKVSCRSLQAVGDNVASTASENGLIAARDHLDPAINPGARASAEKLLVFLTDGIPNVMQSTSGQVSSYTQGHTGEWFTGGSYQSERNAVLMQTQMFQALGWQVHPVGLGLGADKNLMDRMARMAGTGVVDPNNPNGPFISRQAGGNPADYQARLVSIFENLVSTRNGRIVK